MSTYKSMTNNKNKMGKNQKSIKTTKDKMTGSNLIFRGLVTDLAVILQRQNRLSNKKIIETIDTYLCELKLINKPVMKRDLNVLYEVGTRIANT